MTALTGILALPPVKEAAMLALSEIFFVVGITTPRMLANLAVALVVVRDLACGKKVGF